MTDRLDDMCVILKMSTIMVMTCNHDTGKTGGRSVDKGPQSLIMLAAAIQCDMTAWQD